MLEPMTRNAWRPLVLAVLLVPNASALQPGRVARDVEALVQIGPRYPGSGGIERARAYLEGEYRKAGYTVEYQPFTYQRSEDLGSSVAVGADAFKGRAMLGSASAKVSGRLVAVPNVGRAADFAGLEAKGAIALVQRGEIRFLEKVQNAVKAGAVGVVLYNSAADDFSGTLGAEVAVPVLAVPGSVGTALVAQAGSGEARLEVNVKRGTVNARNLIARLEGVTRPQVVVGGHYDTVEGSPGANDNGSGTATILEMARQIARTPAGRRVWFVAFDGHEELGQPVLGSKQFTELSNPELLRGLRAMLNFDMIGVGDRLLLGGSSPLADTVRAAVPSLEFLNDTLSDHTNFQRAGVPSLFFWRGMEPNYHTPNDRVINGALLEENVRLGLAALRHILEPN